MELQNEKLKINVSEHGAELTSIVNLSNGKEMLWDANPTYWKRHSPVLFPIVGSVWNGEYHAEGKVYNLSQHGFARDMDFTLVEKTDNEVWYELCSNEATHAKYPYDFVLKLGYELKGNAISVKWRVENPSDKTIHFQIGAHPAFLIPATTDEVAAYFCLTKNEKPVSELTLSLIGEKGCLSNKTQSVSLLDDGMLPITSSTFAHDALVLEHDQLDAVTLLTADQKPYLRVRFSTPLVGLWAPRKDELSPFVCIEPWYGRCDREQYTGEYADKDWMQHLEPKAVFDVNYLIEIL